VILDFMRLFCCCTRSIHLRSPELIDYTVRDTPVSRGHESCALTYHTQMPLPLDVPPIALQCVDARQRLSSDCRTESVESSSSRPQLRPHAISREARSTLGRDTMALALALSVIYTCFPLPNIHFPRRTLHAPVALRSLGRHSEFAN
jgi:hypothetical protein